MMCFTVYETAEVYDEEIRKARKGHRCEGCAQIIPTGSLYVFGHGVFDGHGFSSKCCGVCRAHQYRIQTEEMASGCEWSESWCPLEELAEWLRDNPEFDVSTVEEGQAELQKMRTKRKAVANG